MMANWMVGLLCGGQEAAERLKPTVMIRLQLVSDHAVDVGA
jgi:hypothetical protein